MAGERSSVRPGDSGVGEEVACASVWCPDFRLQAVVRRVHTRDEATALVDDSQRQSVVLCRNEAAARVGVEPGMRTVQALARCPDLRIERPSGSAEAALGRSLLERALGWAPGVEATAPGWLTLDLSSQPGEEARWEGARRLRGRLYDRGVEVAVGLAETPALARIAALVAWRRREAVWSLPASRREEELDRLSLELAEISGELSERLQGWGIDSLGAFARLRRVEVAARLGDEGVELWLRLNGRLRRPLRFTSPEELFVCHHEFDYEVSDREPLLFVVNRFLDELTARVGVTGRAIVAVHLLLTYTDGACHARRLSLPEPLLDHEPLFHLVGGHLERLEGRAPVESLRLRVEPTDPVATQRTLFGSGLKNVHRFTETMSRLRKLVGSGRVGSPRHRDTHRPGEFDLAPLPRELDPVVERGGPPRSGPLYRRFRSPLRAEIDFERGLPVRVRSHSHGGAVIDRAGPWKSRGDWWHEGRQWRRIEWDVLIRDRGLFRLVGEDADWVIEGRYG